MLILILKIIKLVYMPNFKIKNSNSEIVKFNNINNNKELIRKSRNIFKF